MTTPEVYALAQQAGRRKAGAKTVEAESPGAQLITPHSTYGPGGPTFSRPDGPWVWEGYMP